MSYEFIEKDGVAVLLVRMEGQVDGDSLAAILSDLQGEARFLGGSPSVWDLRVADLSGFTLAEMQRVARRLALIPGREACRVAIVIDQALDEQLIRLWVEQAGLALNQARRIFPAVEAALAWAAAGTDAEG